MRSGWISGGCSDKYSGRRSKAKEAKVKSQKSKFKKSKIESPVGDFFFGSIAKDAKKAKDAKQ